MPQEGMSRPTRIKVGMAEDKLAGHVTFLNLQIQPSQDPFTDCHSQDCLDAFVDL